jgi:hypothetical protein
LNTVEVVAMATVPVHRAATVEESPRLRLGAALMALAGLGFVGYGVLFLVRNFTGAFLELGIGPEQVDVSRAEIQAFSPSLFHYVGHLHIALSGFIAAAGLTVAALAWFGVRRGELWAWITAVVVPVVALGVALPAHYPYGLATVGHLGLIYLATAVFLVGALLALPALLAVRQRAIH